MYCCKRNTLAYAALYTKKYCGCFCWSLRDILEPSRRRTKQKTVSVPHAAGLCLVAACYNLTLLISIYLAVFPFAICCLPLRLCARNMGRLVCATHSLCPGRPCTPRLPLSARPGFQPSVSNKPLVSEAVARSIIGFWLLLLATAAAAQAASFRGLC